MSSVTNKEALGSVFWVFLEKFGYSGISFISTIILARILSPYDFGLIGTVSIFIALSNMFVESGFGAALVNKKDISDIDYSTVFIFNLCFSIVLYFLLFLASPFISDFYDKPPLKSIIRLLSLTLIFNAVTLTQRTHLIRELHFSKQLRISIAALTLSVIIAIVLALKGFSFWALVFQQVCYSFFYSIFAFFTVRFIPKLQFSKEAFINLFGFGGKIFFSSAIQVSYSEVFGLLISKVYNFSSTGYYTQSKKLIDFPLNIFRSIYDGALFPILSKVATRTEFKAMLTNLNRLIFAFSIPLLISIPFNAENIIRVVLGEHWLGAIGILKILSIGTVFLLLELSLLNIFKSAGRGDVFLNLNILKVVAGSLFLIFTVQISLNYILLGIVATNILSCVYALYKVDKLSLYDWKQCIKDFCSPLLLSIISGFIIRVSSDAFSINRPVIDLVFQIVSLLILHFSLYSVFYFKDFKKALVRIRKRKT